MEGAECGQHILEMGTHTEESVCPSRLMKHSEVKQILGVCVPCMLTPSAANRVPGSEGNSASFARR